MRNILVHDYLGQIDLEEIEKVLREDLPKLQKVVEDILRGEV